MMVLIISNSDVYKTHSGPSHAVHGDTDHVVPDHNDIDHGLADDGDIDHCVPDHNDVGRGVADHCNAGPDL
jgi:hypothetical protein